MVNGNNEVNAKNNGDSSKNSKPESMDESLNKIKDSYSQKKLETDIPEAAKKEMEKTKEKLETLKKHILKKYPYALSIGILPPQFSKKLEEEFEIPESETKEKLIHLQIIIPEEKLKQIPKMKTELIKHVKDMKPRLWLHVQTPVDVFNYGLDSKFEFMSAVAMAFPLHDKGFLDSLRVAEIHKSLVLRKFEKYVVSYVIAGSIVRGTATKTSDVDVYIIIDDTDVKRMSRLELREKLRGIIYQYVMEASSLAGVKNKLSPQVYILTDFWDSVKDAHPVIFTFIRDGVPLYDRGAFLPWKSLLRMGRIKPSPEAIDMFMSMGDKVSSNAKKRLLDIVINDIYWGAITPSQALLMLYGLPPPTPKETVALMREIFLNKEKILEKKYIDILDRIVTIYKGFEHEKVKEIKGVEIDHLLTDFELYMKRLKELRGQIEKKSHEKTIEQIYKDTFELLHGIFGKKSEEAIVAEFEKGFVKAGKLPGTHLHILKDIVKAKKQFKSGKMAKHELEHARKSASELINHLIEYSQRKDLLALQKGRLSLIYGKDKKAELILTIGYDFLIKDNRIFKFENGKFKESTEQEFAKAIASQGKKMEVKTNSKLFKALEKELGDFELVI